jgi:hypothetical protein
MKRVLLVLLFVFGVGMLAGCIVPGPDGRPVVLIPPPLPPLVELGSEPYYVHEGYYYNYRGNAWYYSHERRGPWRDLPRDHYPREVRYRHGDRH